MATSRATHQIEPRTYESIPFVDLRRQYQSIKPEVDEVVGEVIERGAFVGDPYVGVFEESFARYVGAKHCIGVSSGTSALELTLRALGVGEGDEVILPANTFIATAEAVIFAGARPVFADIDPISFNLNPNEIPKYITSRTRAVIAVDLYGQPAELTEIASVAREHNLHLVEDACQAHGATLDGRKIGGLGHPTCFSFYPAKNLGAYGEGGAVTTNDDKLMDKIRLLREHGSRTKYVHEIVGHNHRLAALQAAVLSVKLRYLDAWVERRREIAQLYGAALKDTPQLTLPLELPGRGHAYHLYVVRISNRERVRTMLSDMGIGCGIHYPVPLHLQPALAYLGYHAGDFEQTESCASTILSLPMFPELEDEEVSYVAEKLQEVCLETQ